jgi:glycolate oxidase FAD binding subunit
MVASGFAGPARAASGGVRDYLLGVSVIDGLGQPLTFGGQVMKNVAGYDVSRLMAGSWGTLALVTEVSLKVLPFAPAEATLRFDGVTEAEAIDRLNRWAGRPLPLNASCWQPDGVLWLRLRGARAAVDAAVRSLGGQAADDADARARWSALREQTAPFFALAPGECLWRVAVPDTAAPLALGDTLLEWHGAQRWIKRAAADADRVRAAAAAAGGHATLWRAHDGLCRPEAFTPLAGALRAIHQRLKREFDPRGVLGRGRMGVPL